MRSLLKNSGILMLGELFTKMLSVLYLIPLIRINESIGILNATVVVPFGLFVVFGTLGINILLTSEITKNITNNNQLKTVLLTALNLLLILSILSGLVLFLFAKPIVSLMISDINYYQEIVIATKILALGVILFAITAYLRTVITAFGYFNTISFSYILEQIIKVGLILLLTFYFIKIKNYSVGSYAIILSIAIIISMIITLGLYLYKIYKTDIYLHFLKGTFSFNKKIIKHLLWGGIVILAASIYANLFEMIDLTMMQKYFINNQVSNEYNDLIRGIYFTSSWKIIFIPISIAGSIITVMMTKISGNSNDHKEFDNVFNLSLIFGLIAMLLVFSCGNEVYQFLYNASCYNIILFQALLIPFYILRNILGTYVVSANGKKHSIIISLIIMFIIKIIANNLFMHYGGYIGVVYASILSISVSMLYLFISNKTIFNFNIKSILLKIELIFLSMIIAIILLIINYYLPFNGIIKIIIMGIISLIIIGICFYKPFKKLILLIK